MLLICFVCWCLGVVNYINLGAVFIMLFGLFVGLGWLVGGFVLIVLIVLVVLLVVLFVLVVWSGLFCCLFAC